MKNGKTNKKRRGFTLVELTVVMSIIGILVLLAAPLFTNKTEEANRTKHIANVRVLEDAAERYFIDHGKWPRGEEEPYTPEEVTAYAERIFDLTGEEVILEEGHYWNIDYEALRPYAKLPSKDDRANYVLRNPVGKIYYLDGLTDDGATRLTEPVVSTPEVEVGIPDYYAAATDADFTKVLNTSAPNKSYYWRYTGSDEYVIIPNAINGEILTDYYKMFDSLSSPTVKGVASDNPNVTNMSYMFYQSPSTSLDLSHLETSNVTNMSDMFFGSKATSLDLRSFNTENVTTMSYMFFSSTATVLDVSSFNTSKVTGMTSMFEATKVTVLDLSNFDTWNASTTNMFKSTASQTGYARNATDAAKLNASGTARPSGLTFVVQEQPVQYVLATDADFVGSANGSFRYNGVSQYVIIPETIKGVKVTSYKDMFRDSGVKGVVSTNPSVTDMSYMFYNSLSSTLDVSQINTASVTTMMQMFTASKATALDLRSFNTANVTNMGYMFFSSMATTLDTSSLNTDKVTNMRSMFAYTKADALDLSSFNAGNATSTADMFQSTLARTGYARNATDAAKFNASGTTRPSGLTFVVK